MTLTPEQSVAIERFVLEAAGGDANVSVNELEDGAVSTRLVTGEELVLDRWGHEVARYGKAAVGKSSL
jgi:hypothetical protein